MHGHILANKQRQITHGAFLFSDCGSPPYLQNGESSVSATTYGAEAIYSCSDGYGLVGSAAVSCLETGSWDTLPICSTGDSC